MLAKILLFPLLLIVLGFALLSPNIKSIFSPSKFASDETLVFTPPREGLNTKAKSDLQNAIKKFDYLQPSYIPENYQKFADYAYEDSITTNYVSPDDKLMYSGLSLVQTAIDKSQFPSIDEVEKDSNKITSNRKTIRGLSAIYIETTPHLIDPYFDVGFRGSKEEQLLQTNTSKTLYLFTPKSVVTISFGYTTDISSQKAEAELTKMAESLKTGKIPESLDLNQEDKSELQTSQMRSTANNLLMSVVKFYESQKAFPWDISDECLGGRPPLDVQLSSSEFQPCLDSLKSFHYSINDKKYFDEATLPYLYISYGDVENFHHLNVNSSNLEINKSRLPKICFKPLELSDYTKVALYENKIFTDEYPMYTRAGKVNESCKSNIESNDCYSCTVSLEQLL